jgi:integrase
MQRVKFQYGTLVKRPTRNAGFTWTLRYNKDGQRKAMVIGTNIDLPTEADAQRKVVNLLPTLNISIDVYTFGQLIERYITDELPNVRTQTASSYQSCLKLLKARFQNVPLSDLLSNLMDIQTWLADLKGVKGAPLSRKTKSNVKAVLYRLVECSMLWGYYKMDRNPISVVEVRMPKSKGLNIGPVKRLKKPLTPDQYHTLVNYEGLQEHVRVMIKICYLLGLRISEVLGLRWDDVSFSSLSINIVRSVVGKDFGDTKTLASNAVLPIHSRIAEVLKAWLAFKPVVNGWVFGSEATGRPYHRDSLQCDHLAPAGKALHIVNLGWHSFRHSQRANLRDVGGIDIETQKLLMRHANISTTEAYGIDDSLLELKRVAHNAMVEMVLKSEGKSS